MVCLSVSVLVLQSEGWSPASASCGVELVAQPTILSREVALNKVVWQLQRRSLARQLSEAKEGRSAPDLLVRDAAIDRASRVMI